MKNISHSHSKSIVAILLISGLFYFNSCTKEAGPFIIPHGVTQINFDTVIQPIFDQYCTPSCHSGASPAAALDLSPGVAKANIVSIPANYYGPENLVEPLHPETSVLWHKVLNDNPSTYGIIMPASQLPQYQLDLIKTWISQGAH